jgi:cytochrome bd-type quinol oxidase subunit 1
MDSNWLLHYPVWDLDVFGGGFLIALIAVVHVYVAHFAVGGGLFLVLTEMKGYRENSPDILDYTKKHSKFFMLLTMVFGSVTGVGIWFTIGLLSPAATSTLVHQFVFGWATEWVFFLGEIVCLFVYFYTFGKMKKKQHLTVGWIYFGFAWLSLFVINGIVAYMLTPGEWITSGNFWDGLFNPSFVPALLFRTCIAFMLAGLFGFITSVFIKEKEFRETMIRYCLWWVLIPFFFLFEAAYWYAYSLPEPQKAMILSRSPEIAPFLQAFLWTSPAIFIIGVIMAARMSVKVKKVLAFLLLFIGLIYMGSFEWIREAGRRPWLIYGHTYSNSALAKDAEAIKAAGILKSARWVKHREITDENQTEAGKEIFRLLCSSCHSVGGPVSDILPLTEKYSVFGMDSLLDGMGKINDYMPPFLGTAQERKALAAYIVKELHQKTEEEPAAPSPDPLPVDIPGFDTESDEYLLLAWSGSGMRFISDPEAGFMLSPPGSDIYAQLVLRGESPSRITGDVKLTLRIEDGFDKSLKDIEMEPDEGLEAYIAKDVPIMPYLNSGKFHPYPLLTIEAMDLESVNVIASTKITAPVSTELGCKNCHGGKWRVNDTAGISPETARDILKIHDRMSKTHLLEISEKGKSVSCYECHPSRNQQPATGNLSLSASIHGFHANYLTDRDGEACAACHPSDGFTKGFRGLHRELGLDCTSCHGKLEDHGLSLLVGEKNAGKKGVDKLMKHLAPRAVETLDDIEPRTPWLQEPDCLSCHVDFNPPDTDTAEFNQWTKSESQLYRLRTDDAGMMCAACHGIAHAVYPATNIFGNDRDNIPPMQYQENPYPIAANKNCKVCHTVDMEDEIHHPNSLNMFRNTR